MILQKKIVNNLIGVIYQITINKHICCYGFTLQITDNYNQSYNKDNCVVTQRGVGAEQ